MAWGDIVTGALQYLDDSGTALGVVQGGSLSINPNVQVESGIGGQSSAQGGRIETVLTADLLEPVLSYITGMPRATVSTQSTAYTLETGTDGGDYNLTRVQPAGFTFGASAEGRLPTCQLRYWAAKIAEAATGSSQSAPSGLTDCWFDFDVAIDGSDYGCQNFSVSMDAGPSWYGSLDAKSSTDKRFPRAVILAGGGDKWSLSLGLAKKIPAATSLILADAIDEDIDIVIAGSGITFTLSSLLTPTETGPFEGGDGIVIYQYEFQAKPGYGLCTVGATV